MRLTFLEAEVPSTKTFRIENGELQKIGHPRVIDYLSHWEEVENIAQFSSVLEGHAELGHCLLKSNTTRELKWESRAGSTDPNAATEWVCFDIDGFKDLDEPGPFMDMIGYGDVDRVEQYSASSGIVPGRGLSAHVFCLLARPVAAPLLKQHLMHINLTVPRLRAEIGTTRTLNALRWPLDVTTCQNDKLIYIAPPILGPGVKDGFRGKRIRLVTGKKRHVEFPNFPNAEANSAEMRKVLNELREKAGLKPRKTWSYRTEGGSEVLLHPTKCVVTGIKKERGFVYLNLNGGDSFGYYHPENNPRVIMNFKGEDLYYTKDLVPEYWAQVKDSLNAPRRDEKGNLYLAFCDWHTSTYWKGIYDKASGELDLAQARGSEQLADFLKEHGQPVGDYVPSWDLVYDPGGSKIVDLEAPSRPQVNIYRPPAFLKLPRRVVKACPPLFARVLDHVMGSDKEAIEHMYNWLAVANRYPGPVGTGWCLHGNQGSGKGVVLDKVLRPIFGESNVSARRPIEFDSQFNGFVERLRLLWIEESDAEAFKNAEAMDQSLKVYVTERMFTARHMHQIGRDVKNHTCVIVASNKSRPIILPPDDRRWNVGAFQPVKIHTREGGWLTTEMIEDGLPREVPDIYEFLAGHPADREQAKKALNNQAKRDMIAMNRTTIDTAVDAILAGDAAFFRNLLPTIEVPSLSGYDHNIANDYVALVEGMTRHPNLTRDEIFILLNYVVGNQPAAPGKFLAILKFHGIKEMASVRRGDKVHRGIPVKWKESGS